MGIHGIGGGAGSIGGKIPAQGSEDASSTVKVKQAVQQAKGDIFEKSAESSFAKLARSGLAQAVRPEVLHQENAGTVGPESPPKNLAEAVGPESNVAFTISGGNPLRPAGEDRAIIFVGGQPTTEQLENRAAIPVEGMPELDVDRAAKIEPGKLGLNPTTLKG